MCINPFNLMTRLCVSVCGAGGQSCHCSHLGAGKFTLSIQGWLQPLATDWTALTQTHSPPGLESETCDQGVGRAQLPPEAPGGSLWPGPALGGPQASLGLWPHHPDLCIHLHKPSPLGGSVLQITPSSLPSIPIIGFRVLMRSGLSGAEVSNLLPSAETFHRNKVTFAGCTRMDGFQATTQPTILVMKPPGRASLGLVQGASKKQGSRTSVLRLPQEQS